MRLLPRRPVLVTFVLLAAPAVAAQSLEAGRTRVGESSFGDLLDPGRATARQLRRDGLLRLLAARRALPDSLGPSPDVLFEQALLRFERALEGLPDDVDLHYFRALALVGYRRVGVEGVERRTDEAIEALQELRRRAPEHMPQQVAYALGLAHARRGEQHSAALELSRALREGELPAAPTWYPPAGPERELDALFAPVPAAIILVELAAAAMASGRVDTAREAFEQALSADPSPIVRARALWGLALAFDRSGERSAAERAAVRAIEADPYPQDVRSLGIDHVQYGPMAVLHAIDVEVHPGHELHAYDALGWEALATLAAPDARASLRARARAAWRAFLSEGGAEGPHAEHARQASARVASSPGAP